MSQVKNDIISLSKKNSKIEDIYNKVINDIADLNDKQKSLAFSYIKKLEQKKINDLKKSILQ